eukprot:scaffold131180_cov23-Tisochrysis_lutea.AAC.1
MLALDCGYIGQLPFVALYERDQGCPFYMQEQFTAQEVDLLARATVCNVHGLPCCKHSVCWHKAAILYCHPCAGSNQRTNPAGLEVVELYGDMEQGVSLTHEEAYRWVDLD